jgi:hypothetical protein
MGVYNKMTSHYIYLLDSEYQGKKPQRVFSPCYGEKPYLSSAYPFIPQKPPRQKSPFDITRPAR